MEETGGMIVSRNLDALAPSETNFRGKGEIKFGVVNGKDSIEVEQKGFVCR